MAKPILSGPGKVDEQFSTLLKRCLGGIPGQGCGCSCPCKILPGVVDTITDDLEWEALHTEFTGDKEGALIAQAAVKLFQDSHDALAQRATLVLYRGVVAAPIHKLMTSSNAEKAAAGRGLALKAAAAVRKTGLMQELSAALLQEVAKATADIDAAGCVLRSMDATNKLPTDLQMQESTVYDRVGNMFSWVRELVLIWPSNMLAAKIEAPEAAEALQLASMRMQNVLMLEQMNALLSMKRVSHPSIRLFACSNNSLASAVYTVAVLQQRLSRLPQQLPTAVQFLTKDLMKLAACCLPVVGTYGLQLLHYLRHNVVSEVQPPLTLATGAASSCDGITAGSSSSSSSVDCAARVSVSEQAAGVLLVRADRLTSQTLQQLPSDPAVAKALLHMFEGLWKQQSTLSVGLRLAHEIRDLLPLCSHNGGHHSKIGSSISSAGQPSSRGSRSSSNGASTARLPVLPLQECIQALTAAAALLQRVHAAIADVPASLRLAPVGTADKTAATPLHMCLRTDSTQLKQLPLLLLASAAAAMRVASLNQALPLVLASVAAAQQAFSWATQAASARAYPDMPEQSNQFCPRCTLGDKSLGSV